VTDRIEVRIQKHAAIMAAVATFEAYIKGEVLANSLVLVDAAVGEVVELNDEVSLWVAVEVA
jgi:Domain of unknown function (DUF5915)